MIQLVARGLVALLGITLFVEPVSAQQPVTPDPAQLGTAKALRESGKFAEAEKLLTDAIGTNAKQGPAFGSLDFRKELATVYETKAATLTDVKAATAEWGKAQKEWNTLFQFAQSGVRRITPDTPPEQVKQLKSAFYDAYLDTQRVVAVANQQLVKNPMTLADRLEATGKKICDLERFHKFNEVKQVPNAGGKMVPIKAGTEIITPEVWTRYCDLLDQIPAIKAGYQKAGGRFFLERPPANAAPPANDAPPVVLAAPVVSYVCNQVVDVPAPRRLALCGPRKAVLGAWFPR